jgi:hypothetical protein
LLVLLFLPGMILSRIVLMIVKSRDKQ